MSRARIMFLIAITATTLGLPAQAQTANTCLASEQAVSPRGNLASERPKGNREQYQRLAILRWETKVANQSGGAFADWKNAKTKSCAAHRQPPSGAGTVQSTADPASADRSPAAKR
jgi:hypothetical protein